MRVYGSGYQGQLIVPVSVIHRRVIKLALAALASSCAQSPEYSPHPNDLGFLDATAKDRAIGELEYGSFSPSDPLTWQLPNNGSRPPILSASFNKELQSISNDLRNVPVIANSDFYVTGSDCSGYGGRTLMNGRIEICRGTVGAVESRSELAFLVCHELSHLLLGDLSSDRINFDGPVEEWYDYDTRRESLADLLGVDLCAMAGYDPYAAYYALLKSGPAENAVNISINARGISRGPRSGEEKEFERRVDQMRLYLRSHYERGAAKDGITEAFRYLTSAEQEDLSTTYTAFLEIAEGVRSVELLLNDGARIRRSSECEGILDDLREIGDSMDYDRQWIGTVFSYGTLCKDWANAAQAIELATDREHVSGDMFLTMAVLYNYEGMMSSGDRRDQFYKLALQYFDRSIDPALYDPPYLLQHPYVAYILSFANRDKYLELMDRFMSRCEAIEIPDPELFFGYDCKEKRKWRSIWSDYDQLWSNAVDRMSTEFSAQDVPWVKATVASLNQPTSAFPAVRLTSADIFQDSSGDQ